ncbi:L,D-transpeptidase [Patulibacter sp. NPDC049589]|uniref:L,D-transpeptidase family protein n=1 Tax=Patulibacter sp. NPDC049589 TaxID=3154731 RepID=UPI003449C7BC
MPSFRLHARQLRPAIAVAVTSVVLVPGGTARAQTPVSPAAGSGLELKLQRPDGEQVLQGDRWSAVASTAQYAAGTTVDISFTAGSKRITKSVPLQPVNGSPQGTAQAVVPTDLRRSGRVVVRAAVPAGQSVAAATAATRIVRQVPTTLQAGDRGLGVQVLQQMLAENAYVIGRKGVYDARTRRAVLALRKVTGMDATTSASPSVFRALRAGKGRYAVRFPSHGRHVEVDVDRRVLVEVDGGKPLRIFHTSPGKPSTPTIRGSFRVYRKDPGTNAKGMYKSAYFIRGYAVHGFPSVPAGYGASHGCLRVPMADAGSIFAFMTIGMPVDTY